MASSKPKIIYFAFQGRGEPLRLALAAAGVDFENVEVDKQELKSDLNAFHFAEIPRYVDEDVELCQSTAILRHIARKHGLYGSSLAEQARVDEVVEGSQDLAMQFFAKCIHQGGPAARENYFAAHINPGSETASNTMGAHAGFLSRLLNASGWFVASGLTVADIQVAVVLGLHINVFGRDRLARAWPDLMDLHDRVMALPRIAAYRQGPLCLPLVPPSATQ